MSGETPTLYFSRLRWQARRGIVENDLALQRLLSKRESVQQRFTPQELAALEWLLALADQDLLRAWTVGIKQNAVKIVNDPVISSETVHDAPEPPAELCSTVLTLLADMRFSAD